MTTNPVRKALLERTPTFGTWIQLGHAGIAEVLATAGYDWIAADCEHTDIDVRGFTEVARGMYGRGSVPMVRVRENDVLAIRQMLDAGARGVIVPLVNSAEEAGAAVAAAKYPPAGVRGFAFSRMNDWGVRFDEYCRQANRDIAVVVMIESRRAVECIDEILAVDGVDGVFIGPYDLSGSFGIPGQTDHPTVKTACAAVRDACVRHGKSAGIHLVRPTSEGIARTLAEGFTFIALGVDTVFLGQAARAALDAARKKSE
ncbi:MAG: 2,4-dihydroxyhept-2-ene-1,7-dioic acid aldolase [Kiritimatiellaeota bacterium]|nr:2,4-dihydroxyhept-2-ene-1,7-dioic acid aldolase [Kiritimatiellota bacterium]